MYSPKPMQISRVNGMIKCKPRVMRCVERPGNNSAKLLASVAKFANDPAHNTPWG